MAKYEIKHICGHTATHDIVGTNVNNERTRKADRLADQDCATCYEAKKAAARAADLASAKSATADLIPLKGSDKQVAWAITIRAQAIAAVDAMIGNATLNEQQSKIMDALRGQADASWWIDRRHNGDIAIGWLKDAGKIA